MSTFIDTEIALHNSTFDNQEDEMSDCFEGSILETVPSPNIQIFITFIYLLTSALSLIGNVIVIIVQLYGHKSAQNIRKYLINLALSDITIGVLCVPFNYSDLVNGQWIYPHWLCPTVQYVQPLCVFITSVTLSLIGLERYLFALHPLSWLYQKLQSHTRKILVSTWVFGLFYSYLIYGHAHVKEVELNGQIYYECTYNNKLSTLKRRIFMSVNFIITFVFPFAMLIYSYSSIMKTLINGPQIELKNLDSTEKRHSISVKLISDLSTRSRLFSSTSNEIEIPESVKNRLKTIKMLLIVILLYSLCWAPIKLYQFLLEFDVLYFCSKEQFDTLMYIYLVCHWLAMANSFVNPFVYAVMNTSFRYDFWNILYKIRYFLYSLEVRA